VLGQKWTVLHKILGWLPTEMKLRVAVHMGASVFLLGEKKLSMYAKASCSKILQRGHSLKDVMSWQTGIGGSLLYAPMRVRPHQELSPIKYPELHA